jgi:hypothetical protein
VFQSKRQDIIPEKPKLDAKKEEVIQEQAKVNVDLAEWIAQNGVKPGDEKALILANGCKVILKYIGTPYEEVNGLNLKEAQKITDKAKGVAQDFAEENAKFDDKLDKVREKQINQVNTYWDWRKLFAGGIITWIVCSVGVCVLCVVVPPAIPIITAIFSGLKLGLSGLSIVAKFGFTGIVNLIKGIESFRDQHKGTEIGQAFDSHMQATLHTDDKKNLDAVKNHFDI